MSRETGSELHFSVAGPGVWTDDVERASVNQGSLPELVAGGIADHVWKSDEIDIRVKRSELLAASEDVTGLRAPRPDVHRPPPLTSRAVSGGSAATSTTDAAAVQARVGLRPRWPVRDGFRWLG